MLTTTDPVPFYFPPASGRYEVKPGFYRFGHDFGNGQADTRLFQFDRQFAHYHAAKQEARRENISKFICFSDYTSQQDRIASQFIIRQLCKEYPAFFSLHTEPDSQRLECRLTGDSLVFSADGDYETNTATSERYLNGLDALAMQLQEDLALLAIGSHDNRLTAIHLCFPNHWDPREKIGTDFIRTHQPVPGMQKINQSSDKLLYAALHQNPLIRFAWGISSDDRLNHHPEPPSDVVAEKWQGRDFEPPHRAGWLRVERQTLSGLAAIDSVLFTIRTYHYALAELYQRQRQQLAQAIRTMSAAALEYKGLSNDRDALLNWLEQEDKVL